MAKKSKSPKAQKTHKQQATPKVKNPENSEEQTQPVAQTAPETSGEQEKQPSQRELEGGKNVSDSSPQEPPLVQHIRIEGFNDSARRITYECDKCLQGLVSECSNTGKLQDINIECPNCGKTAIRLVAVGDVQSTVAIDSPWQ